MKQYKIEAIDYFGDRVTVIFDSDSVNNARKEAEDQFSEVISVIPVEASGNLFEL